MYKKKIVNFWLLSVIVIAPPPPNVNVAASLSATWPIEISNIEIGGGDGASTCDGFCVRVHQML